MKQKVTVEVEVPENFKLTGEFRAPKNGELFLDYTESVGGPRPIAALAVLHSLPRFILERKPPGIAPGQIWESDQGDRYLLVKHENGSGFQALSLNGLGFWRYSSQKAQDAVNGLHYVGVAREMIK